MLSILIPLFNHEEYIVDAIDRVRQINVPGKKIVIIDDASTDGSIGKVEKYLSQNHAPDVTLIKKPVNKGLVHSINLFIEHCDTDLIYMIASDDIVIPEGISELVNIIQDNENLQFVIGGGYNIFNDGRITELYNNYYRKIMNRQPYEIAKTLFLFHFGPLLLQSAIFKRSIFSTGMKIEEIKSDDYQIFVKIFSLERIDRGSYLFLPEIKCVLYRHHSANSYRNIINQAISFVAVINKNAPIEIRDKAVAYRVSYFILLLLKRGRIIDILKIIIIIKPKKTKWIIAGLFENIYRWLIKKYD